MKEHIEEVLKNIDDIKSIRNSLNYEERNYLASNIDDFSLYDLKPKDLINLYKNIYSLEEAKAKIESTNDIMAYTRLFAITCLPDSLKESYINLYDDINVKSLFISTFDADELKLKYLMTGKYDDYAMDIIPSMTNDYLKMEYINYLEDNDKKADLVTYLESDTLKEEFLSNNSLNNNASYSITRSIKDEDIFLQCLRFNSDEKKKELLIYRKNPHTRIIGLPYISDDAIRNQTSHYIANWVRNIELADYDFFSDEDKAHILIKSNESDETLSDDFILKVAEKINDKFQKSLALCCLKDDKIKEQMLTMVSYDANLVKSIKDEKTKYSYLNKIPDDRDRYSIIEYFKDEELKALSLQFLKNDGYKLDIIERLSSNRLKLSSLKYIDKYYNAYRILTDLKEVTDEDKYQLLKDISSEDTIRAVIESITSDEMKYQSLKYLSNPEIKDKIVIWQIKNNNLKIDYLKQASDDRTKKDIILSIADDKIKLDLLKTITDDNYKSVIVERFKDDELRLAAFGYISSDTIKREITNRYFKTDELKFRALKYMTSDDAKVSVIYKLSSESLKLDSISFLQDLGSKEEVVGQIKSKKSLYDYFTKSNDDELKARIILYLPPEVRMDSLKYLHDDNLKKEIILRYFSPDEREKALSYVLDEKARAEIITRLNDDVTKLKYLDGIKDRYLQALILCSLQDQELKVELLQQKCDNVMQAFILMDSTWPHKYEVLIKFYSDQVKQEAFNYLQFDTDYYSNYDKEKIINLTIKDENVKFEMLKKLTDDYIKIRIIWNLSDELKIKSLAFFKEEEHRATIIATLTDDKLKLEQLESIEDLKNRLQIICSLTQDELKMSFLNHEFTGDYNYSVIASLKNIGNKIKVFSFLKEERWQNGFFRDNLNEIEKLGLLNLMPIILDSEKGLDNSKIAALDKNFKKLKSRNVKTNLLTYIFNNKDNADLLDKADVLVGTFWSLEYTNSSELYNMRDSFANNILKSANPKETFKKIENVFLKNNIPTFAKIFLSFVYLYPNLENIDISNTYTSPEFINPTQTRRMEVTARNASFNTKRMQIILNDLIRIGTHSGNRSLVSYLDNIEKGDKLFKALEKNLISYDNLSLEAKEVLKIYENHLESLYSYLKKQDDLDISSLSNLEKINYLAHKFYGNDDLAVAISNSRYSLPDRIIRSFAYQAGFDTFDEFKQVVINTKKDKEKVSIKRSKELENSSLQLEKGDLIRGIGNIYSVESILKDGNVCKEFLGTLVGSSRSDATPLDIDLSLITEDGKTVGENIDTSLTGSIFGNIYLVIKKDNPEINLTRNSDDSLTDNPYDPEKMELFKTLSYSHFGIRTGLAASDIDYIIYRKDTENSNDLSILKNEIAKNGLYIPVVDMDGKLVFTYEEYESLKDKMKGLSYYGNKEYSLSSYSTSSYVSRLNDLVEKNREDVLEKSNLVYQALASAINQINLDGKNLKIVKGLDTELTKGNVEVLETGSSARGTNVPSDYDFDYIFRLDADIMRDSSKLIEFKTRFCEALGIPSITGDLRDIAVDIPSLGEIKLDVTIIQKNDKLEYSTEMALNDYLTTIGNNNQNTRDVITANIILAKLLFKNASCYKNCRKDSNQGGLGGVGVENWIIQNGGTLESAAKSFLEAAEGKDFAEFKKIYHVHDYGKNHMYRDKNLYPYDDFIYNNMNATGYEKMKNVLNKYLQYLKGDNLALPEIDKIIEELENKMLLEANKSIKTSHI